MIKVYKTNLFVVLFFIIFFQFKKDCDDKNLEKIVETESSEDSSSTTNTSSYATTTSSCTSSASSSASSIGMDYLPNQMTNDFQLPKQPPSSKVDLYENTINLKTIPNSPKKLSQSPEVDSKCFILNNLMPLAADNSGI